jgi:hypothetical protein
VRGAELHSYGLAAAPWVSDDVTDKSKPERNEREDRRHAQFQTKNEAKALADQEQATATPETTQEAMEDRVSGDALSLHFLDDRTVRSLS